MFKKIFIFILILYSTAAVASKTSVIRKHFEVECEKSITKSQARKLIKRVYLTCKSGSKVYIGGCEIDCMKKNTGAVFGGK